MEIKSINSPVILSASRSTDIPAFYSQWFFNRIKAGFVVWKNPFNQQFLKIDLSKVKVVVFWSKNPAPIIPFLPELDKRGIYYYFQFTLNDYEKEGFEPNVPSLQERIETFRRLSELIGRERVIWRFDPILLTPQLSAREVLTRIYHIGNELKHLTDKLVFSFVDVLAYRKVQANLIKETNFFSKETVENAEPNSDSILEIVEGLVKLREHWHEKENWDLRLATCAEKIDLEKFGIEHNRCIDDELMRRLWGDDYELSYFLQTGKLPEKDLFGNAPQILPKAKNLKDKGQRKACGCILSKDIGMYNTCAHFCTYCYANSSRETVIANRARHNSEAESLI